MRSLGCWLAIEPKMEGHMITQQLRKVGNSYVVTVPKEEVERRGWQEGQLLALQLTALEVRPVLGDDLREAIEERWDRNMEALRYLAGR
jgi:antitoxin component of MazEF toxin-antitoxin module